MASIRSVSVLAALALSLGLVACGSSDDDDGGGGATVDAAPTGNIDASMPVDAAMGGGGALGRICNQQTPCPTTGATQCLSAGGPNGFCSFVCAPNQMNMPNAQGQFPVPQDQATHAACQAQLPTGQPGMGLCGVVLTNTLQPPVQQGQQPQQGTTYTYSVACIVQCSAQMTCPTGLTCRQGACLP